MRRQRAIAAGQLTRKHLASSCPSYLHWLEGAAPAATVRLFEPYQASLHDSDGTKLASGAFLWCLRPRDRKTSFQGPKKRLRCLPKNLFRSTGWPGYTAGPLPFYILYREKTPFPPIELRKAFRGPGNHDDDGETRSGETVAGETQCVTGPGIFSRTGSLLELRPASRRNRLLETPAPRQRRHPCPAALSGRGHEAQWRRQTRRPLRSRRRHSGTYGSPPALRVFRQYSGRRHQLPATPSQRLPARSRTCLLRSPKNIPILATPRIQILPCRIREYRVVGFGIGQGDLSEGLAVRRR